MSCSEDKSIRFWKNNGRKDGKWTDFEIIGVDNCSGPVWRASWNFSGTLVAVSCVSENSDNCVKVFRVNY